MPLMITGGQTRAEYEQGYHRVTFEDAPARYTIGATADAGELSVEVISLGQLDDIVLVASGASYIFGALYMEREVAGVSGDVFDVEVITPTQCTVDYSADFRVGEVTMLQTFDPDAQPCTFDVTLSEGNNGQGLTRRFTHTR